MRTIDLTIPLSNGLKMFDSFPAVAIEDVLTHESSRERYKAPCMGAKVTKISLVDHIGTHVDAPVHFIPGGKDLSQYPADYLIGEAVFIDASEKGDDNPLDLTLLKKYMDEQSVSLSEDDIVIVRCTKKTWSDKDFLKIKSLLKETAEFFVEKKIKAVGLDLMAVDCLEDMSRPVHMELLGNGILAIEGLNNLDKIDQKRFELIALPLRLSGTSGSPLRVIGRL